MNQVDRPPVSESATPIAADKSPTPLLVRIPRPITPELLDRYSKILFLSEAQRACVNLLFERYSEGTKLLMATHVPVLADSVRAMGELGTTDRLAAGAARVKMLSALNEFDLRLSEAENAFFSEVESILAEPQRIYLTRVRMHRFRDRSPILENRIIEATIDIAELVEQNGVDDETMTRVEPVLWEYERAVSPMFAAKDRTFRDLLGPASEYFTKVFVDDDGRELDVNIPEDARRRWSMIENRNQALAQMAEAQKRIVRVNREFLPRILKELPPDVSSRIEEEYARRAWYHVYPDRTDPMNLYERLRTAITGSKELSAAIELYWEQYREKYDSLCGEARQANEELENVFASSMIHSDAGRIRKKIGELVARRIELNGTFVKTIVALLPPEVLEQQRAAINAFERRLDREREKHDLATDVASP